MTYVALTAFSSTDRIKNDNLCFFNVKRACRERERLNSFKLMQSAHIDQFISRDDSNTEMFCDVLHGDLIC